MTGYLICGKTEYRLPVLTEWSFTHTLGDAADSFRIRCVYDEATAAILRDAARLRAVHEDETVFLGVVDETETVFEDGEAYIVISGRGLGALLLDNEAEAVQYSVCSLNDIIRNHVNPYGITDIRADQMLVGYMYTVESGSSEWKALERFTHWRDGITPRFSKTGQLVISSEKGQKHRIDDSSGVFSVSYKNKRYGVISEVLVKGRTSGSSSHVYNGEFISRGGMCRRVVYVPNSTRFDAMRYTGEYQIEQSEKDSEVCTLSLITPFSAFANDVVEVLLPKMGILDTYHVRESTSWADGKSCGTRLEMVPLNRRR